MAIRFGIGQTGNPTPQRAAVIIDMIAGISGILISWVTTASFIPSSVSNVIASLLGLILAVALFIKKYFGTNVKLKDVEPEDITEIKTDK